MNSLRDVAADLTEQHMKFIEANYHLHHERLIAERRQLMEDGAVASEPWVEVTPSYKEGKGYQELHLPDPVAGLFATLSEKRAVFQKPLLHQSVALEAFFSRGSDLIVSTGTGSGKTEIFLYSILGSLASEAGRGTTVKRRGFRAVVLYPMNALVADQLGRLRLLLGSDDSADELRRRFGRRIQFGMYTSRTPYHGRYDVARNDALVKPIIDYYCGLQETDPSLFADLRSRGRVPAKDIVGFRNKGKSKDGQFRTQPDDVELFTRQEMVQPNQYGGAPDILVTNYSMLEYMLLRPIEQPMFRETREWLKEDGKNELLIVLDEAHLYRGAQGAEVALLLRRLLQRLGIPRSRVRFILTSASLGSEDRARVVAPVFAASLTGGEPDEFEVVTASRQSFSGGSPGSHELADVLEQSPQAATRESIRALAQELAWQPPEEGADILSYLGESLQASPAFRFLYETLSSSPLRLGDLSNRLFPSAPPRVAIDATANLLHLASVAQKRSGQSLLPARLHVFFKGLPRQYVCVNPNCGERRAVIEGKPLLGKIYLEPRPHCRCGGRVFELLSHRTCGAAYLRAFRNKKDRDGPAVFLWTEAARAGTRETPSALEEVHILVEKPRADPDPTNNGIPLSVSTPLRYLDILTGHILREPKGASPDRFVEVWVPGDDQRPSDATAPWSWRRCPACGIRERTAGGQTRIMDLETKGEDTFANIMKTTFRHQPADKKKEERPNKGRKILCFSDGRQKAATLARDLQRTVELDSFRELVVAAQASLPEDGAMEFIFPAIALYTLKHRMGFFDDGDHRQQADGSGYEGSRSHFARSRKALSEMAVRRQKGLEELLVDRHAAEELNSDRPRKYNQALLRLLGHNHFSVSATLVGFLRPTREVMRAILKAVPELPSPLVDQVLLESIRLATSKEAYDPAISDRDRAMARGGYGKPEEGLRLEDIVPDHVRRKAEPSAPVDAWPKLVDAILYPDQGEKLFAPMSNALYGLNPKAVTLQLALDRRWLRCAGCRQFSAWDVNGICPREDCDGKMEEVDDSDQHLRARISFLRDPCKEVLSKKREPFTIRSEEHSAQLNAKDRSEVFSKTERYELLFQDVLVGESALEQPVDVLSCTTTMEVGIDIGSLTAVAMRTIPPRSENYQQRSGRAGRRGVGLSTIVTFADNSPHETYYFHNPHLMIGAEATEPVVYAGNRKIAERHLNASLLEQFFDPAQMDETADVFKSLGASRDFFRGTGRYSLPAFQTWMQDNILSRTSDAAELLGALLPTELAQSLPEYGDGWRTQFVQDTSSSFLSALQALGESADWSTADDDSDLLSTLLDAALLPTFSFPIDTCNFVVREVQQKGKSRRIATSYEMTRDMKQALSDYIPGRQLVVDKKTFTSYGVVFPFTKDPVNRATKQDWGALEWLNSCPLCETVVEERERDLSATGTMCEVCRQSTLESRRVFRPPAFGPEVIPGGQAEEGEEQEEERVYATPARYPIPAPGRQDEEPVASKSAGLATVRRMQNQSLMVVNFGPDGEGFHVCMKCGAVGREQPLDNHHNRPYPRDFRIALPWPDRCTGTATNAVFGYRFRTDMSVLRVPLRKPITFAPHEKWFQAAAMSVAEALVLGAARALGLDTGELAGGYRTLPRFPDDETETHGNLEFFLYDTTPGGAGFASKAFEQFDEVITETQGIVDACTCASSCPTCMRTYQNRIWHERLDRHLASAMLAYAILGHLPEVEPGIASSLVEQLGLTLALMDPAIAIDKAREHPSAWRLHLRRRSLVFDVRSCMVQAVLPTAALDESISDYEINWELPRVALELMDRLTL